jgi:hypothetical protein
VREVGFTTFVFRTNKKSPESGIRLGAFGAKKRINLHHTTPGRATTGTLATTGDVYNKTEGLVFGGVYHL